MGPNTIYLGKLLIIVIAVYISPSSNGNKACNILHSTVIPNALCLISGDFNTVFFMTTPRRHTNQHPFLPWGGQTTTWFNLVHEPLEYVCNQLWLTQWPICEKMVRGEWRGSKGLFSNNCVGGTLWSSWGRHRLNWLKKAHPTVSKPSTAPRSLAANCWLDVSRP